MRTQTIITYCEEDIDSRGARYFKIIEEHRIYRVVDKINYANAKFQRIKTLFGIKAHELKTDQGYSA